MKIKLHGTVTKSVIKCANRLNISPTQLIHRALTEMNIITNPAGTIDAKEGENETKTNDNKDTD